MGKPDRLIGDFQARNFTKDKKEMVTGAYRENSGSPNFLPDSGFGSRWMLAPRRRTMPPWPGNRGHQIQGSFAAGLKPDSSIRQKALADRSTRAF